MDQFFSADFPDHPFILFSLQHFAALAVLILFNLWLLRFRGASEATRSRLRWGMALVLWGNEIAWHLWNLAVGRWTIQTMIPLHLCSILVWVGAFMLVTRNYTIYEFTYLLGISGALQALAYA